MVIRNAGTLPYSARTTAASATSSWPSRKKAPIAISCPQPHQQVPVGGKHSENKPLLLVYDLRYRCLDAFLTIDTTLTSFWETRKFSGGLSFHYMLADSPGQAATIELKDGAIQIRSNRQPWQITTNFYLAGANQEVKTGDWRYHSADTWLQTVHGSATLEETMQLLNRVKRPK